MCRLFFTRAQSEANTLKCVRSKTGRCLLNRYNYSRCRKCRFEKCKQYGAKYTPSSNNKIVNKQETNGVQCHSCQVCGTRKDVGNHYGIRTCRLCAKWYCRVRNTENRRRFKCSLGDGKCDQKSNVLINACSKCRFNKMYSLIRNAS